MRRVLALPLSTVERAGTGDLVSRTTADVDALARTIRFAIPETLIAALTTVLTVAAAVWVSPAAALALVAGAPAIVIGTRWYLRRAPQGYLRERAAYATLAGTVGETVDGGLTVESLGLNEHRVAPGRRRPPRGLRAERYTLRLRTFWFPSAEIAYVLPVVAGLLWGGWLVHAGHASIGEVTAVVLYAQQLADPVDRLISWLDEIQVGGASLARLVGIESVPPDRVASGRSPRRRRARAHATCATRTSPGGTCCTGSTSTCGRASASPSSGRPARASRPSAGCSPASTRPARARSRSAASISSSCRSRRSARRSRSSRRSSTSSSARSPTTCGSRAPSASPDELEGALAAVDALEWAVALPEGLETTVGAGGRAADAAADAAARARPARPRRPAHARPRRGDVAARPARRASPRALARSRARGADGRGDRAPPPHRARRRPRRGRRGRAARASSARTTSCSSDGGAYAALWESWRS